MRAAAASTRSRICAGGTPAAAAPEPGRGLVRPADLVAAGLAVVQVMLEALPAGALQCAKRVSAGENMQIMPQELHQFTPMQSRIRMRPSRIRVLIVPSATFSRPATSL